MGIGGSRRNNDFDKKIGSGAFTATGSLNGKNNSNNYKFNNNDKLPSFNDENKSKNKSNEIKEKTKEKEKENKKDDYDDEFNDDFDDFDDELN
jgi:hypothetical protein